MNGTRASSSAMGRTARYAPRVSTGRSSQRLASVIVCAAASFVAIGCEERARRNGHGSADEEDASGNVFGFDGGVWHIPRDPDPAVTRSAPVDVASSVCPGTRVMRVDRTRGGSGDAGTAIEPLFFGRDEYGRFIPLEAVLRCELRMMNWLVKPRDEGINLMMWRGTTIFRAGQDCTWGWPAHVELNDDGSRRVSMHERCHHRVAGGGGSDRTVTLELSRDYATLTER